MEYQKKKVQLLQKVEYTNLLSFTLVQNKLERNFKSIVQALMLNQAKTEQLKQSHNTLSEQHVKQTSQIKNQLQNIMKQLQNLKNQEKNNPKTVQSIKQISQNEVQRMPSKKLIQKTQRIQPNQKSITEKTLNDHINKKLRDWQNDWQNEKSDLLNEIKDLKDKIGGMGDLKNEFNNFKIDIKMIQDDVMASLKNNNNNNNKSSRNLIKRQSILNMVANKNTQKNIQKSKHQISNNQKSTKQVNQPSKVSIKAIINQQNKENSPSFKQNNKQNNSLSNKNVDMNQQNLFNQNVDKQINSIYLQLNTMKISFQELKDMFSDNKKQTYKNSSLINQLKDDLNREIKTRKLQNQDILKAIKQIKIQILNIQNIQLSNQKDHQQKQIKNSSQGTTKTSKNIKRDDQDSSHINYKNQLNDKLSRMQAMIQNFITETQFNRFKNDMNDQLQKIWAKLQANDQNVQNLDKKFENLIMQNYYTTNQQITQIKNNLSLLDQNLKNQTNQNQRKHNILQAKLQELKKSLQNLRQDMQFYQSMMNQNKNDKKSSDQNLGSPTSLHKEKSSNLDEKALQNLKNYFSGKMHDLRTNLLGLIRDLEKKLNNKSNGQQEIIKIWDKINQFNLFLNKKADQDDTKKTFLYLQKKLNRLNSLLFKNQDNTQDARIARTNQWYCLSCDKNLQSYKGKLGKHVVWDQMPLKGINKSVAITQKDDNKKSLPQLKKGVI